MALEPLADEFGDVTFNSEGELDPNGDFSFESLGDPALDRIMLRCHATDIAVRQLTADVARVNSAIGTARGMFWTVIAALVISAVVQVLTR